jgi:hypothetical protein
MADEKKTFEIDISTKFQDDGSKKASSSLVDLANKEKQRGQVAQAAGQISNDKLKEYSALATKVGLASAAGLVSVKGMQNVFLSTAQGATATSQQWLKTTDQVQQSMYKVGKTITQEMLPGYKTLANITSSVANFAEKHPGLVQAGTYALGGAAVFAAGVKAITFGKGIVSDVQGILGGASAVSGTAGATQAAAIQTQAATTFAETVTAAGEEVAAALTGGGTTASAELEAGGEVTATELEAGGATGGGGNVVSNVTKLGKYALPVIGGVLVGGAANNAIAGTQFGQQMGMEDTGTMGKQALVIIANAIGKIGDAITGGHVTNALTMSAGQSTGLYNASTSTSGTAGTSDLPSTNPKDWTDAQLIQYHQFLEQQMDDQQAYQVQTSRATRDFNIQQQYQQEDYQKTVFRATRDFNLQQEYQQQDYQVQVKRSTRDFQIQQSVQLQQYQLQQSISTRDFYISQQRAQEDFQLQQSRAEQDYNFSVKMAMMQGDSLGIYMAQYQYNLQKSRAQQDFDIQQQRAKQDFDLQMQDAATQFNITRANQEKQFQIQEDDAAYDFQLSRKREEQQFQIQEQDAAQDFEIQRQRAEQQFQIQMSDNEYNYQLEERQRRQSFVDQIIPELIDEGNTRLKLQQQFGTAFTQEMAQMYEAASSGEIISYPSQQAGGYAQGTMNADTTPSRQAGGYAQGTMPHLLHQGEFVMNADTTAAAERAAQGHVLNQQNIMEMLGAAAHPGMTNNFYRGMSADERFAFERDTQKMLKDAFR